MRIAGRIGAGHYNNTGRAAAMLVGKVGTIKQQELMQQEQAGGL
jgi:hypothetical protein